MLFFFVFFYPFSLQAALEEQIKGNENTTQPSLKVKHGWMKEALSQRREAYRISLKIQVA